MRLQRPLLHENLNWWCWASQAQLNLFSFKSTESHVALGWYSICCNQTDLDFLCSKWLMKLPPSLFLWWSETWHCLGICHSPWINQDRGRQGHNCMGLTVQSGLLMLQWDSLWNKRSLRWFELCNILKLQRIFTDKILYGAPCKRAAIGHASNVNFIHLPFYRESKAGKYASASCKVLIN